MDIDRYRGMTKDYRDGYRQDTEGWQKITEMDIDRHRGMTKDYRDNGYDKRDKSLQRWI